MDAEFINIHQKPKNRRSIAETLPFLPSAAADFFRLIHRTCRFKIIGEKHYTDALASGRPVIAAFWHFSYPCILYFFRDNGYLTIVSRSRDGEFGARMIEKLGY